MPLFPFPPPWIPLSWRSTKDQRSKLRAAQIRALKPPPACLDDPALLELWHEMTAALGLTEASVIDCVDIVVMLRVFCARPGGGHRPVAVSISALSPALSRAQRQHHVISILYVN